jgi:hypothetical protein
MIRDLLFLFSWSSNQLEVSKNDGTPKSSILIGFSSINHLCLGPPHWFWLNMTNHLRFGSKPTSRASPQLSRCQVALTLAWQVCWSHPPRTRKATTNKFRGFIVDQCWSLQSTLGRKLWSNTCRKQTLMFRRLTCAMVKARYLSAMVIPPSWMGFLSMGIRILMKMDWVFPLPSPNIGSNNPSFDHGWHTSICIWQSMQ